MDESARARHLLDTQDHMTLATADATGKPWASPVFFVRDAEYRLYWVSSKSSVHSSNVRARREVGVVVFETAPADGVYIDADAVELTDEAEIRHAMEHLAQTKQPDKFTVKEPREVLGDRAWRIYRATPRAVYVRTPAYENGQAVSARTPVEL